MMAGKMMLKSNNPSKEHDPGNAEPQLGENPHDGSSSSISHTRAARGLVLERKMNRR